LEITLPFRLFLVSMLTAVFSTVAADAWEVYEFPDGRTVASRGSSMVALRAESVLIVPTETILEQTGLPLMNVHAVFHLQSLSDDPLQIKVGFPFETAFGSTYHTLPDSELYGYMSHHPDSIGSDASDLLPEHLNFVARADGQPLDVRFLAQQQDSSSELMFRPVDAVWDMDFAPGQKVRLVTNFYTGWEIDSRGNPLYRIRYFMESGSTWCGSVESATVVLCVPHELPWQSFEKERVCCWDYTCPADLSRDRLVWTFRDFEPRGWLEMAIYSCEPERTLSYVDGRSAFMDIASEISWSPDSIVPSALNAVRVATRCRIPTQLVMDYLHGMLEEHSPGPEELGVSLELAIQMVETSRQQLKDAEQVVRRNGFEEFLPLFALKREWDILDARRYESSPATRRRFHFLLSALPACAQGGAPNSVELSSFYSLLGWYWPGWEIWGGPEIDIDPPAAEGN
jgi:hypothetical protein